MTGAIAPWRFTRKDVVIEQKVAGGLIFDDATLARAAALDGLGVALLAESFVHDAVRRGALVRLLYDWCTPRSRFFLFRPAGGPASAAVRSLMAAIHARCP